MGCCSQNFKYVNMEFTLELYELIQDEEKPTTFEFKRLSFTQSEKIFEKTLSFYIEETKIYRILGDDFKFNINNSLFYCYFKPKIVLVKNFLQVKDLLPIRYENLFKISIVLTKNYNSLFLPKIHLINKTKSKGDLNDLKIDFSDVMLNNDYIFNPNLSNDKIIFSKPNFGDELKEKDENNNNDEIDLDEENNMDDNKSNKSNNSVINEESNEYISEEESDNENNENLKNYILIKGEITLELVKNIFDSLSPYLDEEEDKEFKNVKKDKNERYIRRFRKFGSQIGSSIELNTNLKQLHKRRVSLMNNDNIIEKKGEELKLNLFNNEQEKNKKIQKEDNEQNKIIDSIFIENVTIPDVDIFAELIGALSIYKFLKRISFCDIKLEKDLDIWDNIIYLLQENNNIRWVDLNKSYMDNAILDSIAKVSENKRFRYLNLSGNFIDENGASVLGEFLSKNKTLQRLILTNNDVENFKKSGVEIICKNLENHPNIQLLDISSMNVTGCGEYISNLITKSKCIKNIILKDCLLNLKDIKNICKALSLPTISETIINVDLSHNNMASDKSIEEIGKMLKVNKTLTHLNLENMNLTNNTYNYIIDGLNENDKITHFNFSFNPNIKPKIILEYFLHRKKLSNLTYIPYRANINENGPKIGFNLEEKKIIQKFKNKRARIKLIIN